MISKETLKEIAEDIKEGVQEDQADHAIDFAKWLGEDHYLMEGENIWINCCTGEKVGTTEQLYDIFLKKETE